MDDVIVVGGRCSGAPTAMLLARAAFKVRVIEQSSDLGDTLSGRMIKPAFFRVSAGPGWALVGDAGHHKDPLIARGMADAFRDAEVITATVTSGWDGDLDQALAGYTAQRDAFARPLSANNDSVASGIGSVPHGW
jgi:2-polyprenyl-6-methoxyphenol hydroxylase-like FAD-dependent oxidoreductase